MSNKTNNAVEEILKILNIDYKFDGEKYFFCYEELEFWATSDGNIGVDKGMFGKVPHVMKDGKLCVNRSIEVDFWDDKEIKFAKSILIYAKWLQNLPSKYCIAEILSELDYYINALQLKKVEIDEGTTEFMDYKRKVISSTDDLWFELSEMEIGMWFKVSPIDLNEYYVYVKRVALDVYVINFDSFSKSKMRVSGYNFNSISYKATFIGVGSVNSYIIKHLFSRGLKDIKLIDDDVVRVDNMFRFAFPYIGEQKIDAVEIFAENSLSQCNIEKINDTINKDSSVKLTDDEVIYVSVDNMVSWFGICNYLMENVSEGTIVCFVGVDIFGGFGKYIRLQFNSKEKDQFRLNFYKFLDYTPDGDSLSRRKQMIGNGCGKSIAVYTERDLMKLAHNICQDDSFDEVVYVEF